MINIELEMQVKYEVKHDNRGTCNCGLHDKQKKYFNTNKEHAQLRWNARSTAQQDYW